MSDPSQNQNSNPYTGQLVPGAPDNAGGATLERWANPGRVVVPSTPERADASLEEAVAHFRTQQDRPANEDETMTETEVEMRTVTQTSYVEVTEDATVTETVIVRATSTY